MAVRSKRLAGPGTHPGGNVHYYTTPADETTLVKCIILTNTAATPVQASIFIGLALVSGQRAWYGLIPGNSSIIIGEFIVLQPGQKIGVGSPAGEPLNYYFAGAELEGSAD